MPESSTQYATLTTSDNGVNVMPLLQPKSHFFLGHDSFSQLDVDRFGAISDNEFNTTSKITYTGNVYSICRGSVFLQPNSDDPNNKVNLILKPFKQPIADIPIKYIVYRGLNKADFIGGSGNISGTATTGTPFVQYIHTEFNNYFNKIGEAIPAFSADYIGYPESTDMATAQPVSDLIDEYFYNIATIDPATDEEETKNSFDLPLIPAGMELGSVSGELGIDIVLNTGDYYVESDLFKLDLTYARSANFTLDATSYIDFEKKRFKEHAVQFMDIAAFYGLHANGAGKLIDSGGTVITDKESIRQKISNFYTKDTIYIYLQANRQRSYNFYNNYKISETNLNNMKIGVDEASLAEASFGTHGWPIHEYTVSPSTPPEDSSFTLQLTTDNYEGAAAYVKVGRLSSAHEEGFIRNGNLLQTPSEDGSNTIDTTFTKPITIQVNATTGGVLSSYVQVLYEGREMTATDSEGNSYTLKDIDDLFGLLEATPVNKPKNEFELPTVVDERLQIINFPNDSGSDIGVVKHQKVEDRLQTTDENTFVERVSYETLIQNIITNSVTDSKSSSSLIDSTKSSGKTSFENQSSFYFPQQPYQLRRKVFTENNETITGLKLTLLQNYYPTKKVLGITRGEFEELKSIIDTHNLRKSKVFFTNFLDKETNSFTSLEEVNYNKYSISISGESSSGEVQIYNPDNEILVYSLDKLVFASNNYSKYLPELGNQLYSNSLNPEL